MNEITRRVRSLRQRQTKAEGLLWQAVKNNQLGKKIVRQKPIIFYINKLKRYFIADFYCRESKLVIELDGKIHENQKEYDEARTYVINNMGIKVIRFKNEEIEKNIEKVLLNIKENL